MKSQMTLLHAQINYLNSMEELFALEESDFPAADADFCYQAKTWIGLSAAVLGETDMIVFAGDIGKHCESIRSRICADLSFRGISLSESSNSEHSKSLVHSKLINASASQVAVFVTKPAKDLHLARSTITLFATLRPIA